MNKSLNDIITAKRDLKSHYYLNEHTILFSNCTIP